MPTDRPPLDLIVAVKSAAGVTYQWGPSASAAGDVPQGLSFRTKRGDGFADASVTLSRRIDQDYVDIGLLREVTIVGTGGDIAYEGRIQGIPRSLNAAHSVSVNMAGWMSHTRDRKFREIYVDRDLSHWSGPGVQRQTNVPALMKGNGQVSVANDSTNPSLATSLTPPWDAGGSVEAWYDSAGIGIGSLYYAWTRSASIGAADANVDYHAALSSDDVGTASDSSGNLRATGPGTGTVTATGTRMNALVSLTYAAAYTGDNIQRPIYWTCLAVYGTHGVTKQGVASSNQAQGFYASDVITNIVQRFCPKLNTSGVQQTSYVLQQVAFTERTDPYDAFLLLNRAHLWNLSVYENRTLYFRPTDLDDYDYEVRLSDPGVTVDLQGDDTSQLANGIAVTYTDVATGVVKSITPDDNSSLEDTNPANPANIAGYNLWTELTVSTPCTAAEAVQFGVAALGQFNLPKAPGTIRVTGHIRDRQGHWQPVWKVRADDRVAITDHPNSRPRLVVETDYAHDSRQLTISVDAPAAQLDAVLDRIGAAVANAGLQS